MNLSRRPTCTIALGLSVMVCFLSCQAGQPKTEKPRSKETSISSTKADSARAPEVRNEKIIVYYFFGNVRCPTCHKLENYAKTEVETDFVEAIKAGKLVWKSVNVEEKGNEHFAEDYKLYTKSVIVSIMKDGKEALWKNLDQIWQLVHDEGKYRDYIKREIEACVQGKCL